MAYYVDERDLEHDLLQDLLSTPYASASSMDHDMLNAPLVEDDPLVEDPAVAPANVPGAAEIVPGAEPLHEQALDAYIALALSAQDGAIPQAILDLPPHHKAMVMATVRHINKPRPSSVPLVTSSKPPSNPVSARLPLPPTFTGTADPKIPRGKIWWQLYAAYCTAMKWDLVVSLLFFLGGKASEWHFRPYRIHAESPHPAHSHAPSY